MRCRACGNTDCIPWFDLGEQPLANAFPATPGPLTTYPLVVVRCPTCRLSQLTEVVPPEILYSHYPYKSGVSQGWHQHAKDLVAIIQEHLPRAKFILDIAANDGTTLSYFAGKYEVLGVDPAAETALSTVPMIPEFWDESVASHVVQWYGKPDVILAQNVLGHVADPIAFLRAAKLALAPGGVILVEVPRLNALLETVAFDTIYHEHLSYWSLTALRTVGQRAGLVLSRADALTIHGGSFRCWFRAEGEPDIKVIGGIVFETDLETPKPYQQFNIRVDRALNKLRNLLYETGPVVAYGAAAKGTVLLNEMKRRGLRLPETVMDDSVAKQHRYVAGVDIPVVPPASLKGVDTVMILPWNWASQIKERCKELDFTGKFLTVLPYPKLK